MLSLYQQVSDGGVDANSLEDPLAGRAAAGAVIALNDRRPARRSRKRLRKTVDKLCSQVGVTIGAKRATADEKEPEAPAGLAQEQVIDTLIVARAFAGAKRRRRWANWRPREILAAVVGGTVTLMLLLVLIRFIQTM